MKLLTYGLVLFCWLCGVATFAQNTYALIVGIAQYKEMPALQYPDRDALAFAEFVKGQGVPDQNISLFLNEDATRMNIVDELYRLSRRLKPQDRFYFYFGGHGDLEAKIGYENAMLLLHGSFKTGYFQGKEFLQLSELKTWLTALSKTQTQVIFIADACHSGGLIGGSEGQTKTQRALQESWANVTKILSSQANEFSLEGQQWGGGRGLFSFHLVNGLTGRADVNKNKLVSVKELDEYLRYHVRREASPNVQTPLVVGEPTLALSKSSASGLAQLAVAEKRNFPVISSVNFKGANPIEKLLAKLDTGIVELYKRFSKAVKERRLADHDNAQDNALLHFRAMAGRSIPDTLLNIMKRNLGAALMERELQILNNVREQGQVHIPHFDQVLIPAIRNLEEVMTLFGSSHYFAPLLQARIQVLQSQIVKMPPPTASIDQSFQFHKLEREKRIALLLNGQRLEPNMISTYILLSFAYLDIGQADSSLYYQEKVLELMPNESRVHFNLGYSYLGLAYQDTANHIAPHPKAVYHFEKALDLEPSSQGYLRTLGSLYLGSEIDGYYDYPKAIPYYEKHLNLVKNAHLVLLEKPIVYPDEGTYFFFENYPDVKMYTYVGLIEDHAMLYLLHKTTGDSSKAQFHFSRFQQISDSVGTVFGLMSAALLMYKLVLNDDPKFFKDHLKHAYSFQQQALLKAEMDLKTVLAAEKFPAQIVYREILKGLGVTCRMLQYYPEAESYLNRALAYPIEKSDQGRFTLRGAMGAHLDGGNVQITIPNGIQKFPNGDYDYRLDANEELFFLKWEQGKVEEAFQCLEKAFQVSLAENGNDISGQPFEESIFQTYPNLDQARFKSLKAKYSPPLNAEKK